MGSLCAVLDSSSPWTPSSSACRGSGRTCRGSRPIPSRSPLIALGLALRLSRDAFPIRPGGSLILIHPLTRSFAQVTQAPYSTMFNALRAAQEPDELAEAERTISGDERGLAAYRAGKSCHPCSRTPTGPDALPRSPDSGR